MQIKTNNNYFIAATNLTLPALTHPGNFLSVELLLILINLTAAHNLLVFEYAEKELICNNLFQIFLFAVYIE